MNCFINIKFTPKKHNVFVKAHKTFILSNRYFIISKRPPNFELLSHNASKQKYLYVFLR